MTSDKSKPQCFKGCAFYIYDEDDDNPHCVLEHHNLLTDGIMFCEVINGDTYICNDYRTIAWLKDKMND